MDDRQASSMERLAIAAVIVVVGCALYLVFGYKPF